MLLTTVHHLPRSIATPLPIPEVPSKSPCPSVKVTSEVLVDVNPIFVARVVEVKFGEEREQGTVEKDRVKKEIRKDDRQPFIHHGLMRKNRPNGVHNNSVRKAEAETVSVSEDLKQSKWKLTVLGDGEERLLEFPDPSNVPPVPPEMIAQLRLNRLKRFDDIKASPSSSFRAEAWSKEMALQQKEDLKLVLSHYNKYSWGFGAGFNENYKMNLDHLKDVYCPYDNLNNST